MCRHHMQLHALLTNVHVWQCEGLAHLDNMLQLKGVKLHKLNWSGYDLLLPHDKDHFTWQGFVRFAADLCVLLKTLHGTVLAA